MKWYLHRIASENVFIKHNSYALIPFTSSIILHIVRFDNGANERTTQTDLVMTNTTHETKE